MDKTYQRYRPISEIRISSSRLARLLQPSPSYRAKEQTFSRTIPMPIKKATTRSTTSPLRVRQSKLPGAKTQTLSGTLLQFVLSPKGAVEGLFISQHDAPVQVVVPQECSDALARSLRPGDRVTVRVGLEDESDNDALHHVFRLDAVLNEAGKPLSVGGDADGRSKVMGKVKCLNFAKHGEPNGVVLESGDFVHVKPDDMERLHLAVGDDVRAEGKTRSHVLGGVVLEAESVNGKKLAKKKDR